jgi:hypothetical protein
MIVGMLILFAVIAFGLLTYDRPRFEQKIYKNIPLDDWMLITVFPIGAYIATAFFVYSIVLRPTVQILPLRDIHIIIAGVLILLYSSAGNSIHFTSKVLWKYLDKHKHKTAYEVNELFHGRFSHLIVFVGVSLIMFCICLLEINHPLVQPINYQNQVSILLMSIVTSLFVIRMVIKSRSQDLSWRINRPLVSFGILLGVLHGYIISSYKVDLSLHPFNAYTLLFFFTFILFFLLRKGYFSIIKLLRNPRAVKRIYK